MRWAKFPEETITERWRKDKMQNARPFNEQQATLPAEYAPAQRPARPRVPAITFADFAALAKRRGWTLDFLAERFRGQIDDPQGARGYFARVLDRRHADVVIAHNSVLAFCLERLGTDRVCACGCGRPLHRLNQQWATDACRVHGHRRRVGDRPESAPESLDFSRRANAETVTRLPRVQPSRNRNSGGHGLPAGTAETGAQ